MLRQNAVWTSSVGVGGSRRSAEANMTQRHLHAKTHWLCEGEGKTENRAVGDHLQIKPSHPMNTTPSRFIELGVFGAFGLWLISLVVPLTLHAGTYNLFTTQVPTAPAFYNDYPNGVLGTRFHSDAAGRITALRYYAQPGDNDETTLILWDYATKTELASVSGIPSGTEGWFQLSLPSPVAITTGTEYVVTYNAGPNGNYIGWAQFFDAPLVNGPLTAPVGAGIFGDSGFPTMGPYGNSSYLADVVFETQALFPGIIVLGNGVTVPAGDTTPSAVDGTQFGAINRGGQQSRTFTITNSGLGSLVLSGDPLVIVEGAQASDFTVTTLPVSPVPPGGSAAFSIRFAPAASGTRDATVVLTNNAGAPYQFAIQGIGMGAGYRQLGNQTSSRIQSIPTGQITGSRLVAMRNMRLTKMNIRVARLSASGGNAVLKCAIYGDVEGGPAQFLGGTSELVNPTNGWYSLPLTQPLDVGAISNYWVVVWANADEVLLYADSPGETRSISYTYDTTWPSPVDLSQSASGGTLTLYTEGLPTDATGPEMEVQGNGWWIPAGSTNATYAAGTELGGKTLGTGSLAQQYTILNVGQSGLALTGSPPVTITGPDAGDFVVTAQPEASVPGGGSATLTITFTPATVGARTATVIIPHADSPSPYQFAIRAEGLSPGSGVMGLDGFGIDSRFIDATHITGNRFMAPGDLRITELHAKVVGMGGSFVCAVYADNNGFPGPLLVTTAPVTNPANGWNTFVLSTPLNITGGKFYWLTIWADTFGAALQADPGGTTYEAVYDYAALAGQWPEPLYLNPIAEPRTYCLYAEGTPLVPPSGAAMDLRGNGKLVVSGDASPSVLDRTDFGSLAVGTGILDYTFTIQNSGTAPLLLTSAPPVAVSGPQAGDFHVTSPPSSPVAAGGSTTFTIRFAPTAPGLRAATVSIANTDIDPNKNPYQFAVQGAGLLAGRESLFPDSVVGGDVNNDGTYYELGTIFQSSTPGKITQLRVYSVAGETGDHTARIWRSDQTVVGGPYIWNFGGVNGWIYFDIPPVTIEADVQYTVTISTSDIPNRDYANEPGVLINGGGNGLNLSYPPNAGVFEDIGRGGMPTKSWNSSSYLRDIVFVAASSTTLLPNIVVQGNNTLIPDGYSSPAISNLTDFGSAPLGGAGVERTFVITNSGAAPLNLTGSPRVRILGVQTNDFTVVTQPTTPIAPGGAASFTVRFSPGAAGTRRALVGIDNDDKNPYYFSVAGIGDISFRITSVTTDLSTGNITIQWDGPNQQFQVERAISSLGTFAPIGVPQTSKSYTDPGILLTNTGALYRVRY
jgi:hypothetical protein